MEPGRSRFFGPPPTATRADLRLVVTSDSRDRPRLRQDALRWFEAWNGRREASWAIRTITIEGGTHAVDSANAYRAAMLWLFDLDRRR